MPDKAVYQMPDEKLLRIQADSSKRINAVGFVADSTGTVDLARNLIE